MSAGIEQSQDGRATFVAVEEHGWHTLGTLVKRNITVAEGLKLAHMDDLDYRLEPFAIIAGDPPSLVVSPDLRAVARRNPFDRAKTEIIAAGLTDSYTLHTPEEAFGFGENLIDSGRPLSAMGSIAGGRRAFAAFRMDDLTIGGVDQVHTYLNVMTAFDGTMSTRVRVSAIRVVCQNTFSAVMGQRGIPTYTIRHVGQGLDGRIEDAREALDLGYSGMQAFQAEAEALLEKDVTDAKFRQIVAALLPIDKDAEQPVKDRIERQRVQVEAVWNSPTVANVQNTAWGALNAYTEWLDWTAGSFRTKEARTVQQITPGSRIDKRRIAGAQTIARLVGVKG